MNNADHIKRFTSFIIDVIVVGMVMILIGYLVPDSNNVVVLNDQFNNLNNLLSEGSLELSEYLSKAAKTVQNLDIERIRYNLINTILLISYFSFMPFFNSGQTFGQKIMGIKIVNNEGEKAGIISLLARPLIVCGVLHSIAMLATMYLLDAKAYLSFMGIVVLIQVFMVIINAFMVIYRKDNLGLVDFITKSRVAPLRK